MIIPAVTLLTVIPLVIIPIRDMVCLGGLPGCPGIYQWIVPTALVALLLWKGPKQVRAAEPLGALWLVAFIAMVVMLETSPLRAAAFIMAALGAGVAALALRR